MIFRGLIVTVASFLLVNVRCYADIFLVTNVADSGGGSLRQAILDANSHPNASADDRDEIHFAIPGDDVQTILPRTELPTITDPVVIDGFTQSGSSPNTNAVGQGLNTVLKIELDGNFPFFNLNGLTVTCGNTVIRGLIISRFFYGILCDGGSGNLITGNFIGTDRTGSTALIISHLSRPPRQQYGIFVNNCRETRIGGRTPKFRNLLAGAELGDVMMTGVMATANTVEGNLMGLKATGMSALTWGSGFSVALADGANGNLIGGTAVEARNVLSSSDGTGANYVGVYLVPAVNGLAAPFGNLIKGNFFGLNVTGRGVIDSDDHPTGYGISLSGHDNVVGGTEPGARNIISGNRSAGIIVGGDSEEDLAAHNSIVGNFIGTDETGTIPLPNTYAGVLVRTFANNNKIGGSESNAGNRIAFTARGVFSGPATGSGVLVVGPLSTSGTGNAILGNSIYGNETLGINLGFDGVTPNDPGDDDTGPNNLQNYPVLASATYVGGMVRVLGTLETAPNQSYRIEFFGDSTADSSMYGEGKVFLGAFNVATGSDGTAPFDVSWNCPAGVRIVSATATDSNGNTSEFSAAIAIDGTPAGQLLNISTRVDIQAAENALIGGFIIAGIDPKKVLARAIGPSLSVGGALADTTLQLFQGNTALAYNDNWRDSQQTEIEETGLAPQDDLESAIVWTLTPGLYTAVVRGRDNATGIGLVEIYDLDAGMVSTMANISTRGLVETGDNVMIGGVIVRPDGGGSATVVVRAIGPTLGSFGIPDPLLDPTLDLVDSEGGIIRSNDNWKDSQRAQIEATGLQPGDDRESALIQEVVPGNYTAIVRGHGGTTGVALVEVYHL